MKLKTILASILFINALHSGAQRFILDSVVASTGIPINQDKNKLLFADSSANFGLFFHKLDTLNRGREGKLHIFHIGGSHIQADFYSDKLRCYLQNINMQTAAQRGFVFPYRLAGTNNPLNYRITGNNKKWKGYRSSVKSDSALWGLAGITAVLRDGADTLRILANYKTDIHTPYFFNRIRFFTQKPPGSFSVSTPDPLLEMMPVMHDSAAGFYEYRLSHAVGEANIILSTNGDFDLMGLELMNDLKGIEYTSIGVNGAGFESYRRCRLFKDQLALFHPDLFIISIGTNDANTTRFDSARYRSDYEDLIQTILAVNPKCAILLTVPNDAYYHRKYPNRNIMQEQKIIFSLAKKYQMAVWDLYGIMGGLGSSQRWYMKHLMQRDRIHFTRAGYSIVADLLLKAIVSQWEQSCGYPSGSVLNQVIKRHE